MNPALRFHLQRYGQPNTSRTPAPGPSSSHIGYYFKIDGVPGTGKGPYADWIEIYSFSSTGITNKGRAGFGNSIQITLPDSLAVRQLLTFSIDSTHLNTVLLDVVDGGKRKLRLLMKDVLITNFSTGSRAGEERHVSNLTLESIKTELTFN